MVPDVIHIEQLELTARIGVSAAERDTPQRLTATLTIEPVRSFAGIADRLEQTVDYFAVATAVQQLASAVPRHLIETLASEMADLVLTQFSVRAVEIEVRKFILRDTAFVAVRLRREAGHFAPESSRTATADTPVPSGGARH